MRRRMMRLKDGMLEPVFRNESVVYASEACGVFGGKVRGVCEGENGWQCYNYGLGCTSFFVRLSSVALFRFDQRFF